MSNKEVVSHNLLELAYPDIQRFIEKDALVLIPCGSCEMHGAHLPVGTDTFQCEEITRRAALKADVPYTQSLWTGYSPHHMREPEKGMGTITLRAQTWQNLVYDVARSLIHHGFNKLVFTIGHASNTKIMDPLMRKLRYETGALIAVTRLWGERYLGIVEGILEGTPEETPGWHSAELETSQVLAYKPHTVHMDRAVDSRAKAPKWLPKEFSKQDGTWDVAFQGYEYFYFPMDHNEFSETGVIGNALISSAEKGNKTLEKYAQHLADALEVLKKVDVKIKKREFIDRV